MGGRPLTAMNIICYPTKDGDLDTLTQILLGGATKVRESGAVLAGGHSVEDREPKYGLAVTGVTKPDKLLTNAGAKPGDALVLTKRLGTGVVTTAIKADMASDDLIRLVTEQMAALNAAAAEAMQHVGANACTDITGFGLLGHASEMAKASKVGIILNASRLPLLPNVIDFASMGLLPGGAHNNRCYLADTVTFDPDIPLAIQDLMFDPQTSGGLLVSLPAEKAPVLIEAMAQRGTEGTIIGRVVGEYQGCIKVEP